MNPILVALDVEFGGGVRLGEVASERGDGRVVVHDGDGEGGADGRGEGAGEAVGEERVGEHVGYDPGFAVLDRAATALRADLHLTDALDVLGGEVVDEIGAQDGAVDDEERSAMGVRHLASDS